MKVDLQVRAAQPSPEVTGIAGPSWPVVAISPLHPPARPIGPVAPLTSPAISEVLVEGAALRRSEGPEGSKRLLTRATRARLASGLAALEPAAVSRIETMLGDLEGPGAPVRRAIFLRAVAARLSRLEPNGSAWSELEAFSGILAAAAPSEILERATVLDLNSRVNTSPFDVAVLSSRRGTLYAPKAPDQSADNDGLFQRFTASCGPTVLQMMVAEADPIEAFLLHSEGLTAESTSDRAGRFQQRVLEEQGGIAIGRRVAHTRARFNNVLARAEREKIISSAEATRLRSHATMTEPQGAVEPSRGPPDGRPTAAGLPRFRALRARLPHEPALAVIRDRFRGFPGEQELQILRESAAVPKKDAGTSVDAFLGGLHTYVTPLTGVTYAATNLFSRGQSWRHLDKVEAALRGGVDVPFGLSEPSHWMLLTHVRGKKPRRSFLVSDPEGGRTAWVTEKDLVKGVFADAQFHLCVGQERGYVDVFFLPAE